jgi:hypothetical protein
VVEEVAGDSGYGILRPARVAPPNSFTPVDFIEGIEEGGVEFCVVGAIFCSTLSLEAGNY